MSDAWKTVQESIAADWDTHVIPSLSKFIEVPNLSPAFDAEIASNGLQEKALQVILDFIKEKNINGLTYEVHSEKPTPFLLIEVAPTVGENNPAECKTVLLYGHFDKQPPLPPWAEGLAPYKPVLTEDKVKLYGRGSADDGYAVFSSLSAIKALQEQNIPHERIVITIEGSEESGSPDLSFYMEKCKAKIGRVDLMVCLDSGALNYDQVWLTTSLRGMACGVLSISTVTEGLHSGVAGGVVPDSFRVARLLLDRVEDRHTGEVLVKSAYCPIPQHALDGLKVLDNVPFKQQFAVQPGVQLASEDNVELGKINFWSPSLTVIGDNLPPVATAGNVIRTETELKLSLRVAPQADPKAALEEMKTLLEADPPVGAHVKFTPLTTGSGCATPELKPWLATALGQGSEQVFGQTYAAQGLGGSIPFIAMLIETYPEAQFVVTGVLGPQSNAHGPNEFLHIPYVKGITLVVARMIAAHHEHVQQNK